MSNLRNKFRRRISRPQTIASAIGGLFEMLGARASDADFAAKWPEIMGRDIAKIATLAAIKKMKNNKFNISVRPKNPAFILQLSYQKEEIIRRINKYFGEGFVGRITFRK